MTRLELATTGATIRSSTKLSYIRHLIPFGTPERIRTSDLLIRSQLLYPAELRAQNSQCTNFTLGFGRGERIRTSDSLLPKQVR